MPVGDPIPDPTIGFQVTINPTRPGSAPITLTSLTSYGEDTALAESVVQDLIDLVDRSQAFRLAEARKITSATSYFTPTPPEGE